MSRFHWGWRIGVVYTVFALSTLGFVAFAMTQRVDLVREDYYQESLRTTAAQQELQRGKTSGITVVVEQSMLHIRIPVAPQGAVSVHLYRPDNPALDQHHDVQQGSDGSYVLPLTGVSPGRWRAIVRWKYQDRVVVHEQLLML